MTIQKFENDKQFDEISHIIEELRKNALRKVNEELIMMYWRVGEYIKPSIEKCFLRRFLYSVARGFLFPELFSDQGL